MDGENSPLPKLDRPAADDGQAGFLTGEIGPPVTGETEVPLA